MNKVTKCEFYVDGMHCDACELYVEGVAKKQKGVVKVIADSNTHKLEIDFEEGQNIEKTIEKIKNDIKSSGYILKDSESKNISKNKRKEYLVAFLISAVFGIVYSYLHFNHLLDNYSPKTFNYMVAFTLGIVASVSTCMAVVGSIVLSFTASVTNEKKEWAITVFHAARILGFIVFGGITGLLGRTIVYSSDIARIVEVIVLIAMFGVGFEMLDIRLPRIVFPKAISSVFGFFSDKDRITDAILLGAGTYFLPCGMTQSVQLQALSSGSVIKGALIMGAFVLGTFPVLWLTSAGSSKIVKTLQKGFYRYIMGFVIIIISVVNLIAE